MSRRQHMAGATLTAIIVLALGRAAYGDPVPPPDFIHVLSPWHLTTDAGTKLDLPPSYVLSEPKWGKFDTEMKRLQDQETRLTAENKSLRTAVEGWQPGWKTLAGALVLGVAGGWYLHSKF